MRLSGSAGVVESNNLMRRIGMGEWGSCPVYTGRLRKKASVRPETRREWQAIRLPVGNSAPITRRDLFALTFGYLPLAAQPADQPDALSLAEARPVLDDFSAELPAGLSGDPLTAASWQEWATAHDREIRSRLQRGDADSIVNLLLFGTSFTAQPRCTIQQVEAAGGDAEAASQLIRARVRDFAAAVARPGTNERLLFAAGWLHEQGADPVGPAAASRIATVLLENTLRVVREQQEYNRAIAEAKQKEDAAHLFIERSSLYRGRGLSLDTSFRPNYGIERSLAEMQSAGLLRQVHRAAVLGPGLDFTDKRSGYDFYPVQTLQPFALVDSLRRLRLADSGGPAVAILDLSGRVLRHVRRAVDQARAGSAYTVQLALDRDTQWRPATVDYWRRSCAEIGTEIEPLRPPPGAAVRMRAVRIRPDVVRLLEPFDLEIVIQHLRLPDERRFDLVVATNILVYYSPFEQALALQNLAAMLRPGGVLLSNNVLPEVPGVPMHPAGATSVAYSNDPDDGDHMLWYRRV